MTAQAPTAEELRAAFVHCSNAGRWGADDELGTLNLIDAPARLRAVREVRTGDVVALGRPFPMIASTVAPHPVVHRMLAGPPDAALDVIEIVPHDPQLTHVDALGHTYAEGSTYGGRPQSTMTADGGLRALSVAAMREGIVCRGVLLDVAAARGVPYLDADEYVTADDLDAAERLAQTHLGPGDAVVVHVGRAERIAAEDIADVPTPRAGLHVTALPWLRDRDVAVYLGDCTERLPGEAGPLSLPLHQIGAVAMGLCLIDGALTSDLVRACHRAGRSSFLFCCTIPEVPGATGFPVSPVCVF